MKIEHDFKIYQYHNFYLSPKEQDYRVSNKSFNALIKSFNGAFGESEKIDEKLSTKKYEIDNCVYAVPLKAPTPNGVKIIGYNLKTNSLEVLLEDFFGSEEKRSHESFGLTTPIGGPGQCTEAGIKVKINYNVPQVLYEHSFSDTAAPINKIVQIEGTLRELFEPRPLGSVMKLKQKEIFRRSSSKSKR